MDKKLLLKNLLEKISRLPEDKIDELEDLADFLLHKYEEESLQKEMEVIASDTNSLKFLNDEEELYTIDDIKERYI